jgi:hypothetical protein
MLIVVFSYFYAECHYAECRYAECRYAECRSASAPPFLGEFNFVSYKHASLLRTACVTTVKVFRVEVSEKRKWSTVR